MHSTDAVVYGVGTAEPFLNRKYTASPAATGSSRLTSAGVEAVTLNQPPPTGQTISLSLFRIAKSKESAAFCTVTPVVPQMVSILKVPAAGITSLRMEV